eukprot:CAMPEP_0184499998 /NCGR_PEP_ID=MMETSP0113_2-20130426/43285_1 /TAXON_ID=91329 /ORGANISM="Norrisiella sphaerica, Strain BC52" /LENGTH=210 /DNA_ID=CAMNT_0026888171 /DNA_START=9 /DNA_END=641 /DNA_ORIENTATION=-
MAVISPRLAKMKFMKRKSEAERARKMQKALTRKRKASQWTCNDPDLGEASLIILDEDESFKNRFMLGRRSFGGYNVNIENVNATAIGGARAKAQLKGSVSDEQMAQRYDKFVGLRGKKAEEYERRREGKSKRENDDASRSSKSHVKGKNKRRREGGGGGGTGARETRRGRDSASRNTGGSTCDQARKRPKGERGGSELKRKPFKKPRDVL